MRACRVLDSGTLSVRLFRAKLNIISIHLKTEQVSIAFYLYQKASNKITRALFVSI